MSVVLNAGIRHVNGSLPVACLMNPADSQQERAAIVESLRKWLPDILAKQCLDHSANDGGFDENGNGWYCGRYAGYVVAHLIAARCWAERIGCDAEQLDNAIARAISFVARRQHEDGRIDLAPVYSENEIGFILPGLAEGYRRLAAFSDGRYRHACIELKQIMLRGAQAVMNGSVHTANHRWAAACAPLASVHALWPDPRYLQTIESYLADGVDCDQDGCWYEERSPNYNMVADSGLIIMADRLARPELLEHVVRNFRFIMEFIQPNGEMDSSFSHRQDRAAFDRPAAGYRMARRVAQITGDGRFTTLARMAWEAQKDYSVELVPLIFDVENHTAPLPAQVPLTTDCSRFFKHAQLARIRHDQTALTLAADAGNHFFDSVLDQWGGPRHSDDWLHLHHHDVVIQSIHLAVGGMRNIQPTAMMRKGPEHYSLEGYVSGWAHTLHFRPGRPQIFMNWDLRHNIDVMHEPSRTRIRIKCGSPHALAASLRIWLRPGVRIFQGGDPMMLNAQDTLHLQGGRDVIIRSDNHQVIIRGLPESRHRMVMSPPMGIPSGMPATCGVLSLGLLMPVDLDFVIEH